MNVQAHTSDLLQTDAARVKLPRNSASGMMTAELDWLWCSHVMSMRGEKSNTTGGHTIGKDRSSVSRLRCTEVFVKKMDTTRYLYFCVSVVKFC